MGNLEWLQRAFAIADSGEAETIDDIRQTLKDGGITRLALSQFLGRSLKRQLLEKIAIARHRCMQPPA
jgi:hypothetical protein